METAKRTIHNPQAFVGKVVNSTKWVIPEGYAKCEMTGKLYPFSALEYSFNHHFFNRQFLIDNHIYCEVAAWLSEEGYDLIIAKLDELGVLDAYHEAWNHEQDFIDGKCEIGARGLVWSEAAPVHTGDILDQFGAAPLEEVVPTDAADIADIGIKRGDKVVIRGLRDYIGRALGSENACGRIRVRFFDDVIRQRRTCWFDREKVELIMKRAALAASITNATAVSAEASTAA